MKTLKHILFLILCIPTISIAQDTLTIVHQNALYYGVSFISCTESTNSLSVKNPAFKTIFQYTKPDIVTLNEMSPSAIMQDSLLNNALNVDGITYFKKAPTTNIAGSNIINVVFYNSQKVALFSSKVAQTTVRDINVYTFYCLNDKLSQGDTTFFGCIVGHLKAGDTPSDLEKKDEMVTNTLSWLSKQNHKINYFFMGDFNFYNNSDPGFVTMTTYPNETVRFYDPINQIGVWHDNSAYTQIHTQSTRTSGSCASTGGMDDRFDFIMINNSLKTGDWGLQYIPETYKAVGNDGNHFNRAITAAPTNTLYPQDLVNALYDVSDHLPVTLKIVTTEKSGSGIQVAENKIGSLQIVNPVKENLRFNIISPKKQELELVLYNELGICLFSQKINITQNINRFEFALPNTLTKGIYFLKFSNSKEGGQILRKLAIW